MIKPFSLNASELTRFQPNRYPFLMIDRVTEVVPGQYAKGFKNLTANEWYFPKHFEGHPNMPGALQLEAMAQMLTIAITTIDGLEGRITHALEHKVRFYKEIVPGDKMEISATLTSWKRGVAHGLAVSTVNGERVSKAQMVITIPDIFTSYLPK